MAKLYKHLDRFGIGYTSIEMDNPDTVIIKYENTVTIVPVPYNKCITELLMDTLYIEWELTPKANSGTEFYRELRDTGESVITYHGLEDLHILRLQEDYYLIVED